MKVLIFGPSGAGKTYVSSKLKAKGVNTVDTDEIVGLSAWYYKNEKVEVTGIMEKDFLENHEFLWDREFLANYLSKHSEIFVFGSSGNIFEMLDLFDKIFYLQIDPELQKERLTHETRENPLGETKPQRKIAVAWGLHLEKLARERGIPFLDATLTPEEILDEIGK